MLESDPTLVRLLQDSRARLKAEALQIERADALAWMRHAPRQAFDLVLLDPPFEADLFDAAVRAALDRGVTGVVNVGTGRPRTLGELADAVRRVLGGPAGLVVRPAAAVEPADTWADTTRCAARLGFVPHTDLDALVARQAARDLLLVAG